MKVIATITMRATRLVRMEFKSEGQFAADPSRGKTASAALPTYILSDAQILAQFPVAHFSQRSSRSRNVCRAR
jgi:hypothetical protein